MASEEISPCQEVVECDVCQKPVTFFCRRCGVNLCDTCVPKHLRVKTKHHDVVDYMSKDDDDRCFCDSHPNHECSAYCKTCDGPICILCVSIKHKSHEISELSHKIEELMNDVSREIPRLFLSRCKLEAIWDDTSQQIFSLSSVYQTKKDKVTALGEVWHKLIANHVRKLHQELDDMKKENKSVLQKQSREFEEMIGKIDELIRKFTKLQKSQNVQEIQKLKHVIYEQSVIKKIIQHTFPTFRECKIDKYHMEKFFGYIKKMPERKFSLFAKTLSPNCSSHRTILEAPSVFSVTDTEFPASEMNNRLYDMAVTDDLKVWVGGYSEELKLFDLDGTLYRTVPITCLGEYICMYNDQVVFSDYSEKAIKKISDDGIEVTMFTTGDWEPCGITGTIAGDLLVCLFKDNQSKVVRYSSTGTVLQEIQYDLHGQPLYLDPSYITENVNRDIIVTDTMQKIVIAVNRRGFLHYSYQGKESTFHPLGVVADSKGHVFLADSWGHKIHMLNRDGKFLRYIIPEGGIEFPRALAMIDDGEMIVGEVLTGYAKTIKLYNERK